MYRGSTVAVVVPAYDEEGYVGEVIDTLPAFVDRAYVVDDCSTDGTWQEITERAKERNEDHEGRFEDQVVPIRHEENRGVGGAIKTGYLRAREEGIDVTAVLAGDAQMNPDVLTRYLDPIVEGVAGYAKGNRFTRAEDWEAMPRFRLVGNVILSYLTKVASGYWHTMDSQNGYTAISLDALERAEIAEMYEYYGYCNDLLVKLNAADVTVADVPRSAEFAYDDDWKSHIELSEYVPRVSAMLLRGFAWRLGRKYLLTDYHPVAALYPLGIGVAGTGILGGIRSLVGDDDGLANWMTAVAVGVAVFLYATLLDRAENEHLEVRYDPSATDASAEADDGSYQGDPAEDDGVAYGVDRQNGDGTATDASSAEDPGEQLSAED